MKLEVKVNFDFGKLEREMPKIIHNYLDRKIRSAERGSKENIDKGVKPELKKETIDRRKRRGITGTKPLYETGELYRSIHSTEEGLSIQRGGVWHHTGVGNGRGNPERFFIQESQKDIMPTFDKFKNETKKALHLSTPIVLK